MSYVYGKSRVGTGTFVGDHVVIGHPSPKELEIFQKNPDVLPGAVIGKNCVLRAHGTIYSKAVLGDGVKTGHYYIVREGTAVGENTLIGSRVVIENNCKIGKNVSIQTGAYIPTNTVIEDDVFIAPNVCLTNDKNPAFIKDWKCDAVHVRECATIAANATILPGLTIGRGAFVGAGSVVTKDVPDFKIVYGVPARITGDLREKLKDLVSGGTALSDRAKRLL